MAEQEAKTPAQRPQTGPPSKQAAPKGSHEAAGLLPKLDGKGQALLALLAEALKAFQPQVTASLDEVAVTVEGDELLEACRTLREDPRLDFDLLRCLSVVDYNDHFQVVYHLWSIGKRHKMVLKTNTGTENPTVPSVVSVWKTADWFEREGRDLFGVMFEGHPNLIPLLLWEGFEGYPGRKSYPFYEYAEY